MGKGWGGEDEEGQGGPVARQGEGGALGPQGEILWVISRAWKPSESKHQVYLEEKNLIYNKSQIFLDIYKLLRKSLTCNATFTNMFEFY